jgi:Domain of unknown function DUF11
VPNVIIYSLKWLCTVLLICSILAVGCSSHGGSNGNGGSGIALAVSIKHSGSFAAGTFASGFTITVSNVGTLATQAVITVSDNLSGGLYFIGGDNSVCSFTNSNQNAICTIQSSIVAGASSQISLPVGVGAVPPGAVANTVTASSGGNTSSATDSVFVNSCGSALGSEALLQGHYVLQAQGFDPSGPTALVLSFTADGHGNITAGEADLNNSTAPQHVSLNPTGSSYTVDGGNNACLQLAYSGGTTASALFRFTVGSISNGIASKGWVIGFDGNFVSGILRQQDPTAFSIGQLQANYALGADGVDSSGRHVAFAGHFDIATGGMQYDLDEGVPLGVNCIGNGVITSVSSADGRGLLTINPGCGGSTSAHEALYVVDAQEVFFIQIDRFTGGLQFGGGSSILSGRAVATGSSFSASALSGNYILHMTGQTGGAAQASLALLTFTPGGASSGTVSGTLSGTLFSYNAAAGGTTTPIAGASYTVDPSSGRVTFSGTDIGSLVAYLATPTDGISAALVGEPDDVLGFLEFQPTETYSTANIDAAYTLGTEDPGDNTVTEETGFTLGISPTPAFATAKGPVGSPTAAMSSGRGLGRPLSASINSDGTGTINLFPGSAESGVAITNGTKIFFMVEAACGSGGCIYPPNAAVINVLEK